MAIETERKFLVDHEKWKRLEKPDGTRFRQGYLSTDPERTVRIRIAGNKATLTIKGRTTGASRTEIECTIAAAAAAEMLDTFALTEIDKTRYFITCCERLWEVDEFSGDNDGLIVAELELESEEDVFEKPEWVSDEVTHDSRYFNSALSLHPYKNWKS